MNTFPELEPMAVKALADGTCFADSKEAPPVYYIGPLITKLQLSGLVFFIELSVFYVLKYFPLDHSIDNSE